MSNLIVYTVLILIIVVLSIYYNELNKKKIILQEFFTNESIKGVVDDRINSVFSSLNALSKDYSNLQEKNQLLNTSLQQDHYNKYSTDLRKRYTKLSEDSGSLGQKIRTEQEKLKTRANKIRDEHKADYIENKKNQIINENTQSIQNQLNLDDVNAVKVREIVSNIINSNSGNKITDFRQNMLNNKEVLQNIDDVYNKAKQELPKKMGSIQDSIKNNIDKYVKESLEKKKLSLPFEDLSKYQGALVRTYASQSNGAYGSLLNEYVVPSINYYMSDAKDGFFNSSKNMNISRFLEFIGFIQFPKDVNTLQFYISTGSSVRFYFGGSLLIDQSNDTIASEQTTRMLYGEPNSKVPFKIQINEGTNGNSSYVILKWRKNDSGIYDVVPSSSFFLPNLKSY
jgi:hypothetical protein